MPGPGITWTCRREFSTHAEARVNSADLNSAFRGFWMYLRWAAIAVEEKAMNVIIFFSREMVMCFWCRLFIGPVHLKAQCHVLRYFIENLPPLVSLLENKTQDCHGNNANTDSGAVEQFSLGYYQLPWKIHNRESTRRIWIWFIWNKYIKVESLQLAFWFSQPDAVAALPYFHVLFANWGIDTNIFG